MTPGATFALWSIPVLVPLLISSPAQTAEQPPFLPGTILTVAGTPGKAGFSGDGGPATQARLTFPTDVAIDGAGNLFIADAGNSCIRRVSPDGIITTVAGIGGRSGFSGDGGPATQARLWFPHGLMVDAAGALWFADSRNRRVRKVDSTGMITTVAGGGRPADGLGDGGPATAANLPYPNAVVIDPMGNLLISDLAHQRVRKVDLAGMITTVAGGGRPADGRGDGGLATDAHLSTPYCVTLDPAGNLYIVDWADNRVRRVSLDGKIATVAGGGNPADGIGDGGPATEARLDGPSRMVVDPGGNFFITENHGERIRKVSPAGIITTVAGTGQVGYTGDGGPATAARLNSSHGLCLDRTGNLFFTEVDRLAVRRGANFADDFANDLNALFANFDTVSTGNNLVRKVIGVAVPQ